MTQTTSPEREALEKVMRALNAVLCETNGVYDNIWRLRDGTEMVADWPWASFEAAIKEANTAYAEGKNILGKDFNVFGYTTNHAMP